MSAEPTAEDGGGWRNGWDGALQMSVIKKKKSLPLYNNLI